MIKVTCKDGIEPVKEEYPCLKKSDNGCIVAFIAPRIGIELDGGKYPSGLLYYSTTWTEQGFRLYTGTVELSNEL